MFWQTCGEGSVEADCGGAQRQISWESGNDVKAKVNRREVLCEGQRDEDSAKASLSKAQR